MNTIYLVGHIFNTVVSIPLLVNGFLRVQTAQAKTSLAMFHLISSVRSTGNALMFKSSVPTDLSEVLMCCSTFVLLLCHLRRQKPPFDKSSVRLSTMAIASSSVANDSRKSST